MVEEEPKGVKSASTTTRHQAIITTSDQTREVKDYPDISNFNLKLASSFYWAINCVIPLGQVLKLSL